MTNSILDDPATFCAPAYALPLQTPTSLDHRQMSPILAFTLVLRPSAKPPLSRVPGLQSDSNLTRFTARSSERVPTTKPSSPHARHDPDASTSAHNI